MPEETTELPPIVFNSGYTGGVSMYGQLMGNALSARGYPVFTYDVAGFFTNKHVRNCFENDGKMITRVSLEDQKQELLAAISWVKSNLGRMPVVASWAMGSVASLAAVIELHKRGGGNIPFYVPMNYSSMRNLQNLRQDPVAADKAIQLRDNEAPTPPFDTGTEKTKLGFYPLDQETQAYVDKQLGAYTDKGEADPWPGCTYVSAGSYKSYVLFDPESQLPGLEGELPPALIVHGADNTLHMPAESVRLHDAYPGEKGDAPLMIAGMQHGQQMEANNPVFKGLINHIDGSIRSVVGQIKKSAAQ